ncbi:MAG: hypothetical protein EAZ18_22245, partial [Oscillatoriales cyanobacterium]
ERTFALRQGFQPLADSRVHKRTWRTFRLKLTPMGSAVSLRRLIVGTRHCRVLAVGNILIPVQPETIVAIANLELQI